MARLSCGRHNERFGHLPGEKGRSPIMKNRGIALLLVCLLMMTGLSGALADETPATAPENAAYTMQEFTAQPDIHIAYPVFADNEPLNALVMAKVESLVPEDVTGVTIHYTCAVTLLNDRFASMVFWGDSDVAGSAHPATDIATLNVDLTASQPVALTDLYDTNADFVKTFFANAAFPSDPVTSYSADMFAEMLALQAENVSSFNPFGAEGLALCFLKPDGLVLSMSSIHATGSDHFEAQLNYSDIQSFYRLSQNVWEN